MKFLSKSRKALILAIPLILLANEALAASAGLPWEDPFDSVVNSVSGPILRGIAILLIVAAGLTFAMNASAGVQKFMGAIFGLSIAGAFIYWMGFFDIGAGALL